MELCGEVVNHKFFGRGQIVKFVNNYVTVLFDEGELEKKFTYPSAFGPFLELEKKSFLKQIEEDKNVIIQKEAEKKRISEEKVAMAIKSKSDKVRRSKSTNTKTSDRNNIAFKCTYCDGGNSEEIVGFKGLCSDDLIKYNINVAKHIWCCSSGSQCYKYLNNEMTRKELNDLYKEDGFICYESKMLEFWRAYAGITQSGLNKGKPMTLRNVSSNSLALLTTRLPHAKDKDRFIFAVFLVDENYEGGNREEGYVGANSKYRIQLSLDEAKKVKFWDYYFNSTKPEKILFGSGMHRYLTDVQSAQVLKKICEIKKGTLEEELLKEFLEHYCKIKEIDIDNIPIPNGALQRLKS